MPKRRNPTHWNKPRVSHSRKVPAPTPVPQYILENVSLAELTRRKQRTQDLLRFHWDFYSELAFQRQKIVPELIVALNENCVSNYEFTNWQRGVKYKYSFHPLSTVGSLADPGGRFNIGAISPQNFPQFPALYLASDKDTAIQETLGQSETGAPAIDSLQRALVNPASFTFVSVSGVIETLFDLRDTSSLTSFFALIKNLKLSSALVKRAKLLGVGPVGTVTLIESLIQSFLDPDWRTVPMLNDVPANSQIFGHLLFSAGIDGVIYPSKHTSKDCLALFTQNFQESSTYIELDDQTPHPKVPRRIDRANFKDCDRTPKELIAD